MFGRLKKLENFKEVEKIWRRIYVLKTTTEVWRLKPRVDDYSWLKAINCEDAEFKNCMKEGAGDGRMSVRYWIPGFLRVEVI